MFFRKRKFQELETKEKAIQAIRQETLKKVDAATSNTKKLNKLLDKDGGVTQLIFLATGGDRRGKK